jgi:hypothetical protein
MTRRFLAAGLALLLAAAAVPAGAQQCVSGGEGRQLVAQGQVAPLPVALQRAGLGDAQVISARLCRAGGGWSYRVRVRQGGQVRTANIPG